MTTQLCAKDEHNSHFRAIQVKNDPLSGFQDQPLWHSMPIYVDVMIAITNKYGHLLVVRPFHIHFCHVEWIAQFRIHANVPPFIEWQLGQISQPFAQWWDIDETVKLTTLVENVLLHTHSGPNRRIIYMAKLSTTIPARQAYWLLTRPFFLLQRSRLFLESVEMAGEGPRDASRSRSTRANSAEAGKKSHWRWRSKAMACD